MNLTCYNFTWVVDSAASFHVTYRRKNSGLLDLVHTDIYSMRDRTIDDALYFMTFMDDHFRKLWAYSFKSKDQILNVFK
jgi:hypothetical protein